ncbi:MAG: ThuA domain-containing protein [Lacipirellulaceae bacterium]
MSRFRPRFEVLEDRCLLTAFDVLVFSKAEGFRHESIPAGIAAIRALGAANDFTVIASEDPTVFTQASLASFEAVVFLNTTGPNILSAAQRAGFQSYIQAGGGYVGVHAAADTGQNWAWYGQLVGAYFITHPAPQTATVIVEDRSHVSTSHLPERWVIGEEWYDYNLNPRGDVQVLMSLDKSTYTGSVNGPDHPISWYQHFQGGRSWYTGLGHFSQTYDNSLFRQHLLGGIKFAAGESPADRGGGVDTSWQKTVLQPSVSNPMSLDVAPDGKVFFVELTGRVRVYNPVTNATTTAATFPVILAGENGMLGIVLDPAFATNNHLFLYYTPQGTSVNRLARFTWNGSTLDMASQVTLLEVPIDLVCCHAAGSLAFGPDGSLYISTGDNTGPAASGGYTPIDERLTPEDRRIFDAQRSSANTNDLRGKVLRIKPQSNGTYTIPAGNLFPANGSQGRPEIFAMGTRNPFRLSIDEKNGFVYWGDVGPDAQADSILRGPRGFDEINQARSAGNYGWPYAVANNLPYVDYDFDLMESGDVFDPAAPVNNSPNNTGATNLPPSRGAFIWYPYGPSTQFPALGDGGRTSMAGPVYNFDAALASARKMPASFDNSLIMYEWSRSKFWQVKLDAAGGILKINPLFTDLGFVRPIDVELGPDGALYVLQWGTNFGGGNANAQLVRIDFVGNLSQLPGDYNRDGRVNAADYTVWRDQVGPNPGSRADGTGDGVVDTLDYNLWVANYGRIASATTSTVAVDSTDGEAATTTDIDSTDSSCGCQQHIDADISSPAPDAPQLTEPEFEATTVEGSVATAVVAEEVLVYAGSPAPAPEGLPTQFEALEAALASLAFSPTATAPPIAFDPDDYFAVTTSERESALLLISTSGTLGVGESTDSDTVSAPGAGTEPPYAPAPPSRAVRAKFSPAGRVPQRFLTEL